MRGYPASIVIGVIVLAAVVGPMVLPWRYDMIDWQAIHAAPMLRGHIVGTDAVGRDLLARTLVGARVTLAVAVAAATVAMMPTATIPHPDTAVKDPAASMVSRMKARLSIARTCSAGGSGSGARWSGVTEAMVRKS